MNPPSSPRRLVLIVDDDALLREYLGEVLRHAGHDTLDAGTAAQALRVIEERGADIALVLLDIEMPGMSGLDLARLLREESPIPFMFLSASDDAASSRAAADAGAVGYVVKPVDAARLLPAFEAALARGDDIRRLQRSEANLTSALAAGRETSIAVGILMARFRIDRHTAFEAMRDQARTQRRKVGEVAEEILAAEETLNAMHAVIGERIRGRGRT
ncbi:ANTAR domain-containing response regulator [Massilia sp. YIM B02443]|uniref:ANTAR domain-containing response regulator n=1 Tax=Massilia sp. YIM B02443 TaxID=3050127 RepID=UPI0025B6D523|nr:response regulator [Massilia sp. YIM B02443]MDN4037524.1 response regulator [Massilia sp. YIM B02443]